MTDLNKLRSEFEVIPEIKAHLDHGNVFWSDKNQTYASEFQCLHAVAFYVNGAWFMFQEKAKAQAVPDNHILIPKDKVGDLVTELEMAFEANPHLTISDLLPLQQDLKVILETSESGAEG
ncbi:hypothetical protein ACN94T_001531 [Acinetobacter baumannii]